MSPSLKRCKPLLGLWSYHSNLCLRLHMAFPSVCLLASPFLSYFKRTLNSGPTLIQGALISRPLFEIRLRPGGASRHNLFCIQPTQGLVMSAQPTAQVCVRHMDFVKGQGLHCILVFLQLGGLCESPLLWKKVSPILAFCFLDDLLLSCLSRFLSCCSP